MSMGTAGRRRSTIDVGAAPARLVETHARRRRVRLREMATVLVALVALLAAYGAFLILQ